MLNGIIERIRERSREEWESHAVELLTDTRIWLQEHGELAFFGGLGLGVFAILAFKLFVTLTILGILGVGVVWALALPQSELQQESGEVRQSGVVDASSHQSSSSSSNGSSGSSERSSAVEPTREEGAEATRMTTDLPEIDIPPINGGS